MTIGLIYDLREDYLAQGYSLEQTAEFDRIDTIEGIAEALRACGHTPVRIGHIKQLVAALACGERWDLVFNIAEGLYGPGREAAVPALLDAYQIPYTFSGPLVLALTLHKGLTKQIIRAHGIPTADFAVVETPADIARVNLAFPLFIKPVAEGTGKGISEHSLVEDRQALERGCNALLQEFAQPVLVETFLPGREFTAAVLGSGDEATLLGVMEVAGQSGAPAGLIYSYHAKAHYENLIAYHIPEEPVVRACGELALRAWRALGCLDGGRIDIRMDAQGLPSFIEVNPLAGLNPVHSDLPIIGRLVGMDFQAIIAAIVDSARARMGSGR